MKPRAEITVFLEPEGTTLRLPRPKTVQQLLNRLGLRPTACLVIRHPESASGSERAGDAADAVHAGKPEGAERQRKQVEPSPENARDGSLLTHDLAIRKDDVLTIRKVASRG